MDFFLFIFSFLSFSFFIISRSYFLRLIISLVSTFFGGEGEGVLIQAFIYAFISSVTIFLCVFFRLFSHSYITTNFEIFNRSHSFDICLVLALLFSMSASLPVCLSFFPLHVQRDDAIYLSNVVHCTSMHCTGFYPSRMPKNRREHQHAPLAAIP